MAQFVNMFEVDLDRRSYPVNLNQTVSEGNVSSNRIGAYVYRDGAAVNLGGNCTGMVMRADGSTVPLTGVIDGNAAYVVLDQPSCAIPGPIQVAVNWVSGSKTTTLLVAYGTVIQTDTRDYVQPGTPIPDINELLAAISEMEQATADAEAAATKSVRYDTTQSLTDAQKSTARANIDAPALADVAKSSGYRFIRGTAESQADDGVYRDLNTVPKNCIVTYYIYGTASISNTPDMGYSGFQATVITFSPNGTDDSNIGVVQMCIDAVTKNIYMRINWTSNQTWTQWFTPLNSDVAAQLGLMRKYSGSTSTIMIKNIGRVIRQGEPIYLRCDSISTDVYVGTKFATVTLYGVYGAEASGGYDVIGQYLNFGGDVVEVIPINDYDHINAVLTNYSYLPSGTTWSIYANTDQTAGSKSLLGMLYHAPLKNGLLKPYNSNVEVNKLHGLKGNAGDVLTLQYTAKTNIDAGFVTVFGMYGNLQSDGYDVLGTVSYGSIRQMTLQRQYAGFQTYSSGVSNGASYCISAAVNLINGVQKEIIDLQSNGIRRFNTRTCNIFKKVVCIGDSYTSGHIQTPDDEEPSGTNEQYAWPKFMEHLTGNTYVNCGISGATTVTWQTGARGLPKAQSTGRVQAYVIGLMINDSVDTSTKYVPVGTISDIGTNNNTYYAQMSKIVREINAISPQAKIFINTCPQEITAGLTRFVPYNQAVRDIVEYYKNTYPVHCIDLVDYADLYMVPSITDDSTHLHYTALGYEQFAEIYAYILSEYIDNHVSDFQNVYKIPFD